MNNIVYILCALMLTSASLAVAQENKNVQSCASFNLEECAACCKKRYNNHPRREAKIRECMERYCASLDQPFTGGTTAVE
jgi:hypothetical protein